MPGTIGKELPQYYYHDHFKEVVSSIRKHYGKILSDQHHQWIADFESLPFEEQCLYLRMINRKGKFFRKSKLAYTDILDVSGVLTALLSKGYLSRISNDDFPGIWDCITKNEIVDFCTSNEHFSVKPSWKKAKLVQVIAELDSSALAAQYFSEDYVVLQQHDFIEYFLFLYSGKLQSRFDAFTLRDLGVVRVKEREISNRFESREEAEECYYYQSTGRTVEGSNNLQTIAEELLQHPEPKSSYGKELRSKVIFKLARKLERQKTIGLASQLYELSEYPNAQERLARIKYNSGDKKAAKELLIAIIEDPNSDEDYHFAVDFYKRKFDSSKKSYATQILNDSKSLDLDEAYLKSPERGVIDHYREKGHTAFHGENRFWLAFFGLIFWQEIEADKHSCFDGLPQSLRLGTFYANHKESIDLKIQQVSEGQGHTLILDCVDKRYGKLNSLIRWSKLDSDLFIRIVTSHSRQISKLLLAMAQNFQNMKDGYPDVIAYKANSLSLIEVKAEGDLIRKNQLVRINQLQKFGFDVEILQAKYGFNPDQKYTVVDIETTGGRKTHHRITEIAAIKVQNGKVIDKWHSLLNPEKRIPNNIVRLTGITNEMVAESPKFLEVADSLSDFFEDTIFVAHNASFDYGFISEAYKAIGKRFRMPKFCTVVGMRRYYKGLKSYSLGSLAKHFSIDLVNHHRTMDDAEATVELLRLINAKRECLSSTVRSLEGAAI